jgi:hypothetical protein
LRDKNNNPVIIPLTQHTKGNFNHLEIDINLAKTIYGKTGFENWIKAAVDNDRLLFVDKKKTGRALSGTNQPQQSPSILPPGIQRAAKQDVSGFFINNISRYKENIKRLSSSAVINGRRMLFHTNVNQLAFDFDNDAPPPPPPPREIIETLKTTPEESGTPQDAESGPAEDATDAGTPDLDWDMRNRVS